MWDLIVSVPDHCLSFYFNPKLQRPWKGPMIVVESLNEVLFRIQSGPKSKPLVVHHAKLKPYLGEEKPEWFVNTCIQKQIVISCGC